MTAIWCCVSLHECRPVESILMKASKRGEAAIGHRSLAADQVCLDGVAVFEIIDGNVGAFELVWGMPSQSHGAELSRLVLVTSTCACASHTVLSAALQALATRSLVEGS